MFGRKVIFGSIVCLSSVVLVGLLLAQPAERPERGRDLQRLQRRGGRFDPEQMQRMMTERMKETLGVTDEEWKVVEPRLTKVLTLSRQAGGRGGLGMLFGRRRFQGSDRGPRPGEGQSTRELTDVEKCVQELQEVIDNKEAKPDQIKAKLTALRQAREKARQELAKAQEQLRKVLTVRQEAQLVLMGTLN